MKKKFSPEEYKNIALLFREKIGDLNLEIDILVGHPEETEEQFWQLQGFLRHINPDKINLIFYSEYIHGPSTQPPLALEELGRRATVLTDIQNNIAKLQNERWLGWEGSAFVESRSEIENMWIARNYAYKPLLVESLSQGGVIKIGDVITVKITRMLGGQLKADRLILKEVQKE